MPSGTGKTVSLLSLIVSYQQVSHNSPFTTYSADHSITKVLPNSTKADLLFSNSSRDWKSSGRIEKADGISNLMCRDRRRKGKGAELHRIRAYKSKKSLYPPRGAELIYRSLLDLTLFLCRFQKRRRGRLWMLDVVTWLIQQFAKREELTPMQ